MATENEKGPEWLASLWRESLRAMSLGWDLAIPIFGGVLLGNFLDKFLGTKYIFTVGLIFFGIFVSYYNLGKFIQRMRKLDEQHMKEKEENETIERK
jgi:F0F1-type ATP synthase assembly protein I